MKPDELHAQIERARTAPASGHDRVYVQVSPRDYLLLKAQFFPKLDPPFFHAILEDDYINVTPNPDLPDGTAKIDID